MTNTPADTYTDLKAKLREMFQMDQADLDFGIYRIMNAKRDEISDYLDNHLQPQVKEILQGVQANDLDGDIKALKTTLEKAEINPEESPKYQELLAKKQHQPDITALEREIFSDLYSFFARYYEGGDFLSLRRYKAGVYAIPYEGEEVKLHWANADQYYIKTSEYFANYAFKLGKKRIAFRLVSASTEQNNNKAAQGKERRFILSADKEEQIKITDEGLVIGIEYRLDADGRTQKIITEDAVKTLAPMLDQGAFKALFDLVPDRDVSVLEHHLNVYTKRNSFDYFIHKDLGGFLKRELDFFIKNEVLFLDNFIGGAQEDIIARLAKVRALKAIADKIIKFLTGLEEFQKKLWLKKKFVVAADWCMTLDFVDEKFYKEIVANQAQHDAWVALFGIDGLTADLGGGVAYKNPLSEEFLRANQNLVLDTALFDADFKHRLMASIDDLDERTDGLLIHGDNFHALNLLQEGYREQIKCIYIDPPYNTAASEIIYKNSYKHSSWASMMNDRLDLGKNLLSDSGFNLVTIDYAEFYNLGMITDNIFGVDSRVGIVTIFINPKGRQHERFFSSSTEYMIVHAKDVNVGEFSRTTIDDLKSAQFNLKDDNGSYRLDEFARIRTSTQRSVKPKFYYPIYVSEDLQDFSLENKDGYTAVYPVNESGEEYSWKIVPETFEKNNKQKIYVAKHSDTGKLRIYNKFYEQQVYQNIWYDKKYFPEFQGTTLVKNILGEGMFSYPKSIYAVSDSIKITSNKNDTILDYFAGSGTTGHAVINLNREDGGKRKYILVEMGEYFETVTKPRIQKVIYAKDWKDGKPNPLGGTRTDAPAQNSHCFKTIRLESYEDALNNLEIVPTATPIKQAILKDEQSNDGKDLREQYMLSYMLEMEAKISILNLDRFARPFDYTMNITTHTQTAETPVDLVETFNYLIGLRVIARGVIQQFNAQMEPDEHGRIASEKLKQNNKGEFSFQKLEGINVDGKAVLVIWRTLTGDLERDSVALNKYLLMQKISPREHEFDVIYVNGDNTLLNIRKKDKDGKKGEDWKVQLIEDVFFDKMFAGGRG